MKPRTLRYLIATLGLAASLAGCSQYSLKGRVIEGAESQLIVVDANDPRLGAPGLPDARIELTLDPTSLGKQQISTTRTQANGDFNVPVSEFGAGVLRYELGALIRLEGYRATHQLFWLPPSDKRVLISLKRGKDLYVEPTNPMHEAQRFLENLN